MNRNLAHNENKAIVEYNHSLTQLTIDCGHEQNSPSHHESDCSASDFYATPYAGDVCEDICDDNERIIQGSSLDQIMSCHPIQATADASPSSICGARSMTLKSDSDESSVTNSPVYQKRGRFLVWPVSPGESLNGIQCLSFDAIPMHCDN
jgi:hypothetical protein